MTVSKVYGMIRKSWRRLLGVLILAALHISSVTAECDLSAGKWVYDPSYKPLYSAASCPSLRTEFACQRHGRKDWRFMKYVWRSPGCNIQRFNPHKLLPVLRNKVLMHTGDSLSSNLESSMHCLFSAASPTEAFHGRLFPAGPRATGYRVPAYNLTVLHAGSNFLLQATTSGLGHSSDPWTVNLKVPDTKWTDLLPFTDFVIFSTGHWFRNSGSAGRTYLLKGRPANVTALGAMGRALRTARQHIASTRYQGMALFLSYTANHYESAYMPKSTVTDCSAATTPFDEQQWKYALRSTNTMGSRNVLVKTIPQSSIFKIIDVSRASVARPDGHLRQFKGGGKLDCVHFCNPGVPDSWADIVYSNIMKFL